MIKVSILVPIYNVEKYLPECLDSLVNQTLKDIEIICINDGSTDYSLDIVKTYAKNDSRIVIINKKNSGYGDSMNQGLKKAKGEYIGIVESDDFIDKNAFEELYQLAKNNNAEVVKANFYEYFGDTKRDKSISSLFLPDELHKVINPAQNHHIFYQQPSIWAAIYRKDFLEHNNIAFLPTPGASYQDAGFNFKVWASAERVFFTNQAFLHYRQDNTNSSVKSSGKVYCVKDEYDEIERFLTEKGKIKTLGPIMTVNRFGGYIWNINRLTFSTAMKFSKTITDDYKRSKQLGYLKSDDPEWQYLYHNQSLVIRHPKIYIFFRPIYVFLKSLKQNLSKLARKISPAYRERITTMNLIDQVHHKQNELEKQLTRKEANHGRKS